jgi:HK97 family phage prohead protease
MTTLRKLVQAQINALGDREVEVVMSTAALARDGHILVPQGCELRNYLANPIALWSHDPEKPVGNAENIVVASDNITARAVFAPPGISAKADEICGLVKAGVIRAVSIGFDPLESEPLDPKKPRGGQRITRWELLELSFVSVPADVGAVVAARSNNGEQHVADWKLGAAKGLPIEDSDDWDGGAAAESVFAWAGGDEFDAAKARQAFLVYDAAEPKDRDSYKLPIAHVVDGKLTVPKGAIRAAASRLPQTDIPDDLKKDAGEILDHYRAEAGIGDENRSRRRPKTRANGVRHGKLKLKRGLYQVAELCWLFEELGWQLDMAKYEAGIEDDDSKVPAMLAAIYHDMGEALLAMSQEEIAEALAGHDVELVDDEDDDALAVEERAHIRAARGPRLRAFRRARAHVKLRAGKALSAETVRSLRDAQAFHEDAIEMHRAAIKKHREGMGVIDDMMDRAGVADEDEATTDVQTAAGDGDSGGAENGRSLSADYRKRQADLLAFLGAH